VPARSIMDKSLLRSPPTLFNRLELRTLISVPRGYLIPALAYCLSPNPPLFTGGQITVLFRDAVSRIPERGEFPPPPKQEEKLSTEEQLHSPILEFAEYLALAPIVPFEESPLIGSSLGAIFATGSAVGTGTAIGFIVAGGPTPLLALTVPAGIIICGAAVGVAEGLQAGLRHRLTRLIGGPDAPQ
jgi:hypothetical protein